MMPKILDRIETMENYLDIKDISKKLKSEKLTSDQRTALIAKRQKLIEENRSYIKETH